jgi:hypothetical protein
MTAIPKGFTRWHGAEDSRCHPIRVEVLYRDGSRKIDAPEAFMWDYDPVLSGADILAYRVIYLKPETKRCEREKD